MVILVYFFCLCNLYTRLLTIRCCKKIKKYYIFLLYSMFSKDFNSFNNGSTRILKQQNQFRKCHFQKKTLLLSKSELHVFTYLKVDTSVKFVFCQHQMGILHSTPIEKANTYTPHNVFAILCLYIHAF